MKSFMLTALLIPVLAACAPTPPKATAPVAEREAVLATVQAFFDGMAAKDVEVLRQVLVEDGIFHAMQEADGRPSLHGLPNTEFLRQLPEMPGLARERMWAPEVRIHGPIATVWARYDFWIDGNPSHCGVDAFHLVRASDGWKIVGGLYTVERDGCGASAPRPPRQYLPVTPQSLSAFWPHKGSFQ